MANIKDLAVELASLTSEEIAALNTELGNLGATTSVSLPDDPPKLPPIGSGFPGDPIPIPPGGDGDDDTPGNDGDLKNDPKLP